MRDFTHPATLPDTEDADAEDLPDSVTIGHSDYTVSDGTVTCPDAAGRTLALRWGVSYARIAPDRDVCGATTHDGTPCENPAGWGRDTESGACTYHYEDESDGQ